jgi:GNAT superfamily N-acetyltransferase
MTEVTVRVLEEDDWSDYRRMRLSALETDPDAFVATLEEEREYPEERWRDRIRRSRRLVASAEGEDVGVASVGAARDEDGIIDGVAELFGMWVRPGARGSGIASHLVAAAADQARRAGHRQLRLWVSTDNGRAVGFFSGYGFRPADDRRPMTTDNTIEEIAMTLPVA